MFFVYCDDAGNTGLRLDDAQQPYHLFGGVLFDQGRWEPIKDAIENVCKRHLPTWGVAPETEIHAQEIWNGSGVFKGLSVGPEPKVRFFRDLFESTQAAGPLTYLWGAADKQRLSRYRDPWSPIEVAAWMLVERIAEHCFKTKERAVVIADRSTQAEKIIRDFVIDYRLRGPMTGMKADLGCIVDNVHFLDAHHSRHIQLADVFNYIKIRQLKKAVDKHGFNGLYAHLNHAKGKSFPGT